MPRPANFLGRKVKRVHHNQHYKGTLPVQSPSIWDCIGSFHIPAGDGKNPQRCPWGVHLSTLTTLTTLTGKTNSEHLHHLEELKSLYSTGTSWSTPETLEECLHAPIRGVLGSQDLGRGTRSNQPKKK